MGRGEIPSGKHLHMLRGRKLLAHGSRKVSLSPKGAHISSTARGLQSKGNRDAFLSTQNRCCAPAGSHCVCSHTDIHNLKTQKQQLKFLMDRC